MSPMMSMAPLRKEKGGAAMPRLPVVGEMEQETQHTQVYPALHSPVTTRLQLNVPTALTL